MINGKCTPIGTNPKTQDPAASAADAAKAAADAKAAASAASARAYAAAKAAGDSDAAAKAAAGVNPSALAASESGAIGAASIAAQLKAAEIAQRAADIAAAQATQLANFRAKEAADEAAANARAASNAVLDADERTKFRAMQDAFNSSTADTPTGKFKTPTMDNAKGLMGGNGGGTQNIYVTVQGTVTGEQDLVQTIRNGLLRGQYNGQSTVLEAI
jgi:hypothetical protein